jgi:hypothetical protein
MAHPVLPRLFCWHEFFLTKGGCSTPAQQKRAFVVLGEEVLTGREQRSPTVRNPLENRAVAFFAAHPASKLLQTLL